MQSLSNIANGLVEAVLVTAVCLVVSGVVYAGGIRYLRRTFDAGTTERRTLVVGALTILVSTFAIVFLSGGIAPSVKITAVAITTATVGTIVGRHSPADTPTALLDSFAVGAYGGVSCITLLLYKILEIYASSPVDSPNYSFVVLLLGIPLPLVFGVLTLLPNTLFLTFRRVSPS